MYNATDRVKALLRPELQQLSVYHVPPATNFIKLDAMENPYDWPEELVNEWLQRLRTVKPNRYPDPSSAALCAALVSSFNIPAESALLLGNGSDELIQIILMAIAGQDAVVLAPEPTFVMYRQIAIGLGLRFEGVPLRSDDFSLDMPAMIAAIETLRPAVIFLAYPNNPTGNLFRRDEIEQILALSPGLVVVDEAYAAFTDSSFMPLLPEFPNLLVMRTLSKQGLAGLRLGYMAGDPGLIAEFNKLRLPYNINILTQASAELALAHAPVFDAQVRLIREQRRWLLARLNEIASIRTYPSEANFITFRVLSMSAIDVFNGLRDAGILIKNLDPAGGLLSGCLRVTVGTPEENRIFVDELHRVII
ncbi:histidinol-phosphate transaminase [Candidatus Methylospira mobilis]|uniref:Histidinol-phosphate aminotransferase n=1 Tax=Candidatus Methylospira mobilis TaxID=1808979 RepID=A0A5Q0BM55_9GAMM|nr:histidinol-phosphate transaminase [Candidatus Methylospira mobilis]QFY43304.1 histidinol-phosphate transaminase [Candidatus Methylospira mobilis]WNV03488.1 histidinol-phosphate transaminase [Candidatus Methylospira mobilis]